MQSLRLFTCLLSLLILIGSCTNGVTPQTDEPEELSLRDDFNIIEIDNRYQMAIPKYMKQATDLSADASLQFQNIYKETYVVVINEPAASVEATFRDMGEYDTTITAAENYLNIQYKFIQEGMDIREESLPEPTKIGDLDAHLLELKGAANGTGIYYFLAFINGPEDVYMVMAWTLEDNKEIYRGTFEKMIRTFRVMGETSANEEAPDSTATE